MTAHSEAVTEASQVSVANTLQVIRRTGEVVSFDQDKIALALKKAFLAVEGSDNTSSDRLHRLVENLTKQVVEALARQHHNQRTVHIETIQDQVELALMRAGEHKVARAYVLYREKRAAERAAEQAPALVTPTLFYINAQKQRLPLDRAYLQRLVNAACRQLTEVSIEKILTQADRDLYQGIPEKEIIQVLIMAARTLVEEEPSYSQVAARLLLIALEQEALTFLNMPFDAMQIIEEKQFYSDYFLKMIETGVQLERLDPRLLEFDLSRLAPALVTERDGQFTYLGLQTLYDRYFLHHNNQRFELPQAFFMRVAMGLALNEVDREAKAIEFYQVLSSFDAMSSTPTLFNSGTLRPQLSSCYLTTVSDDLNGIYNAIKDNALLSKYAGGLGNDWSRVRGMGAHIKGTNGKSQGVVPFLKVVNDTAVAVNQGGKRKGAVCAYLETWHVDIEEFLELRKNTGDDRRRTHDMNTANWVPDLFMQRVAANAEWTLFSPDETKDLHDLTGQAFAKRYHEYEQLAEQGCLKITKKVKALDLWRKMLSMLYETGHPWITFKDPCNVRSPQQHGGVVHSSNLCTEITLNTSDDEIAVCNLASINLAQHIKAGQLDSEKLKNTIRTVMRMLDNVIDINYYSVPQARRSNLKHRPVGLGVMGFQDALYQLRLPYASEAAVTFADRSMEEISFYAIEASSDLARERGSYATFAGSLWSQGVLPLDSIELLEKQRGEAVTMNRDAALPWEALREKVKQQGMRNSNTMAIAPTATISNICGVTQSIEPTYQHLYVKSNLSGEFTVVNTYLVNELKALGLWDKAMVSDIKFYDGSIAAISRIPEALRQLFAVVWEIEPQWLIEAASRRQKWLDQAQSLNLYMTSPSGKKLDQMYRLCWEKGLKTTYYLRTRAATQIEKSTQNAPKLNAVKLAVNPVLDAAAGDSCESCQ